MEFIKYLDFFSIKFNFYTNNQPNYQNIFGGIMTFIYILCCILLFIYLSYEDLSRINPTSSVSEIPEKKAKLVNLKEEKIWIPFRLVTQEKKFVDHRGYLTIYPYLVEGKYSTEKGMLTKYHLLNLKLCNETSMINETHNFKIEAPLNELFCIENENISFGGNWNDDYINYIEINLVLCNDEIYYNPSDERCQKITEFINSINTSLSIDFYYPLIRFQPTNYKRPIEIIYRNYIYKLSAYNYKIEKLYLQEHILSDDKSFIKTNSKNSSCWGISSLYGDDYYLSKEFDPISKDRLKLNKIYTMEIYMDDGLVYYKRSYKKIILIISNVFPIFRFVLYFIKKFTQHAKMSIIKRRLAGLIFENLEPKPKKAKNIPKPSCKDINNLLINKIKKDKASNEENNNNNINIRDKSDVCLNYGNAFDILNKKELSLNIRKKSSKEVQEQIVIKEPPKKVDKKKKEKKDIYIFPYYYFFLDCIFDNLIFPQKFFCMQKAYFTVYNFMCQIYDISTHIILFKQFNLLNNIMLEKIYEDNGICPTKPYNKINIGDIKTVEKINKDLKNKKSILFSNNLL